MFEANRRIRLVAHGDDHRQAFGAEATTDERQRHRGLVVEPLGVVDDDEDGLGRRSIGHEAQDGEADEERVDGAVLGPSEYRVHRLALGFGEPAQTLEDR